MAFYADEEDVWKCQKHPSKRRRSGICHVCLRERLSSLCPDCARVRPCACYATTSEEPSFGRSRSLFMRTKPPVDGALKTTSFWKMLKGGINNGSKSKRYEGSEKGGVLDENEERRRMMRKSRSVAVTSDLGGGDARVGKGKGWHFFPSPIKALRQSIWRGVTHEKSPLHRG